MLYQTFTIVVYLLHHGITVLVNIYKTLFIVLNILLYIKWSLIVYYQSNTSDNIMYIHIKYKIIVFDVTHGDTQIAEDNPCWPQIIRLSL